MACLVAGTKLGYLRNATRIVCSRILHTNQKSFNSFLFDVHKLRYMNRRELQQLCKKLGLRANCKTATMLDELTAFYHNHVSSPSSVLHFPYIPGRVEVPNKAGDDFAVTPPNRIRNTSLFAPLEPTSTWTGSELRRLCKTANARGSTTATDISPALQFDFLGASKCSRTYLNKVVSVSHILNNTSRANKLFMISKWRKKQINEMGEQRFREHAAEMSRKGVEFHRFMDVILSGHTPLEIPKHIELLHKSVSGVLQDLIGITVTRRAIRHCQLGYSGSFDSLALYRDSPCVIEWKTSQKPKRAIEECFDYPLQVVAYAGALNSDPATKIPVTQSMIVVAYHDGSPADVHFMDLPICEKYWQFWLLELRKFKEKQESMSASTDTCK